MIKVVSELPAGRCFPPNTPISSTHQTDCHDKTEILLKMALNTSIITHPVMSTD